ncbi:ABC transporter ATP-binding protein [Pelomonas sp. CA6]|uniref:ABC transporter ATP-binding protein n=1 Tax=Pelomonas sp. CA6 TaxID=2907999 RepID=UPI001F4C442B|nr:ABC transporter ATP-binding protein [Pelomonas sp. CA6]MCH7345407.1 ABC transporter ATP-binding protein [Pelomonas sp. CA6]
MSGAAAAAPVLSLRGITKSYRTGDVVTPVLHGIDLEVQPGEYVALMGASGSGKSTLMNLMGLLDRCDAGELRLQGRDVSRLDAAEQAQLRNQAIGFVFQSFNLLKRMSVAENVALPLIYAGVGRLRARERAQALLQAVGLGTLAQRMPSQLSGGQQQRVAIARALANEAPLLLADEPTGNLDTQTTAEVLAILDRLNREQGLTIVLVTHEPDVALHARRLVRLTDGRVSYDGPPGGDPAVAMVQRSAA